MKEKQVKQSKGDSLTAYVGKDSDPEVAIKKFMKKVRNSGILDECYERSYYEKPSVKNKKKHMKAVRALRSLSENS